MRVRICVAMLLFGLFVAEARTPLHAFVAPAPAGLSAARGTVLHRVEDTCWWWTTRWQYGWRGYGWYSCWEWTKPQPTVVSPEELPPGTVPVPQRCIENKQDAAGKWHTRKVC